MINVYLSALPRCPAPTPAHTPTLLHFLLSLGVHYGLIAFVLRCVPGARVPLCSEETPPQTPHPRARANPPPPNVYRAKVGP